MKKSNKEIIEDQFSNEIRNLKNILQFPHIYLASYFKDLRSEVDERIISKQVNKPAKTNDEKISRNLLNDTWKEMIEKIDLFEEKCLNSTLSNADEIDSKINAVEKLLNEDSASHLEKIDKEIEAIEKAMLEQLFQNRTITLVNMINLNNEDIIDFKLLIINDQFIKDINVKQKSNNLVINNEYISLREIQARFNKPGYIIEESLDLKKLKKLALNQNHITDIVEFTFNGFANLQELDLHDNRIAEINKNVFHGLLSLKVLDLSHNEITELSEHVFKGLYSLFKLDLRGNNISEVNANTFYPLKKLQTLLLGANKLNKGSFICFRSLKNLCLNNYTLNIFYEY